MPNTNTSGPNPLNDPHVAAFVNRFRHVSTNYPHLVSGAYRGDIALALADEPAAVAARVAAWERRQGLEPRDWSVWGRTEEGHSGVDPG